MSPARPSGSMTVTKMTPENLRRPLPGPREPARARPFAPPELFAQRTDPAQVSRLIFPSRTHYGH